MALDIACPACGEADALRGDRDDDVVHMTCEACGHTWDRDLRPTCPRCGGDDLKAVPKAIAQKVRGNQVSVVGTTTVHLCRGCDAEALDTFHRTRAPLPPDERPV